MPCPGFWLLNLFFGGFFLPYSLCIFFCWTCDTPVSLVRVCAGPHFIYFAEAVHFCPVGALASNLITPRM